MAIKRLTPAATWKIQGVGGAYGRNRELKGKMTAFWNRVIKVEVVPHGLAKFRTKLFKERKRNRGLYTRALFKDGNISANWKTDAGL